VARLNEAASLALWISCCISEDWSHSSFGSVN